MHIYSHIYTDALTHTRVHAAMYVHSQTHTTIQTHPHTHTRERVCSYTPTHTHGHACSMHVLLHTHTHTHTNTHTHEQGLSLRVRQNHITTAMENGGGSISTDMHLLPKTSRQRQLTQVQSEDRPPSVLTRKLMPGFSTGLCSPDLQPSPWQPDSAFRPRLTPRLRQ